MSHHALIDSLAKTQEVRAGHAAAEQSITDALIATLIQSSPHLAGNLAIHLTELAAAQRMQLASEGGASRSAFDTRIHQTLGLIDALKGH